MSNRKRININDVALSYLEQNEAASPTIFFIHGNSGSANVWQKQFEDTMLSSCRLIAFDLPGHGQSSPIEADENILMDIAVILARAVQQLSHERPFLLVSLSLGTNIAVEMLTKGIRPAGIALLGPCILGSGHTLLNIGLEGADMTPLFSEKASSEAIEAFIQSASLSADKSVHQRILADYKTTVPAIRPALLQAGLQERYSDEIKLLRNLDIPLLVIFGKNDRFINPYYLDQARLPLWRKEVFRIPGCSHFIQFDQPEVLNTLLRDYVQQFVTGNPAELQNSKVP